MENQEQAELLKKLGQLNRTISLFEQKYDDINLAPVKSIINYSTALQERFILFQELGQEQFNRLEQLNQNRYQRIKRLYRRIKRILASFPLKDDSTSVFLTFTFDDDSLSSTSSDTRRQYVRKWLKAHSEDYVANIDFGKTNGREHYHAVAYFQGHQDLTSWQYGALNCKRVPPTDEGKALSKYIAKLGAHATKDTTQRSSLIYSRSNECLGFQPPKYNPYEIA